MFHDVVFQVRRVQDEQTRTGPTKKLTPSFSSKACVYCSPDTFIIVISTLTVSSRPYNPLNAFLLAPQTRLTTVRVYKLYLLT